MPDALEDRINLAIKARGALEPLCLPWVDGNSMPPELATQVAATVSIAISLKRIADELCGTNTLQAERLGLIDTLFETRKP